MVTKLQFILFYSIFLFFIIQITAMAGVTLIKGVEPPVVPTSILDAIFANFEYFFKLMRVSTDFAIFGTIILTPFIIALLWIIIELVRGV